MSRQYAGATRRLRPSQLRRLRPHYRVQPKIDGQYCELHLDGSGRVARVLSRGGREVRCELLGALVHAPGSVLVGELEAHTERGMTAARHWGYQRCHVFDLLRFGARDLSGESYEIRRDLLWRFRAELEYRLNPDATGQSDVAGSTRPSAERRSAPRYRTPGGRFVCGPCDWRRAPIVEQWPASQAEKRYEEILSAGGEGVVIVDPLAPVGSGKRKCKPTDYLDARVLAVDRSAARLLWERGTFCVGIGTRVVAVGQIWTVAHEGYYGSGEPRFARLLSLRADLMQ